MASSGIPWSDAGLRLVTRQADRTRGLNDAMSHHAEPIRLTMAVTGINAADDRLAAPCPAPGKDDESVGDRGVEAFAVGRG